MIVIHLSSAVWSPHTTEFILKTTLESFRSLYYTCRFEVVEVHEVQASCTARHGFFLLLGTFQTCAFLIEDMHGSKRSNKHVIF